MRLITGARCISHPVSSQRAAVDITGGGFQHGPPHQRAFEGRTGVRVSAMETTRGMEVQNSQNASTSTASTAVAAGSITSYFRSQTSTPAAPAAVEVPATTAAKCANYQ